MMIFTLDQEASKSHWPTFEEIEKLQNFDSQGFPYPWTLQQWQQLRPAVGQFYLLLTLGPFEKLEAMCLFEINRLDEQAHLYKILVNPKDREKGIAKSLICKGVEELRSRGVNKLFLEVQVDNLPAVELYKKTGFNILHTAKGFYSDGHNAHIMELRVD